MLAIARNELLDHRYRVVRWIGQGAWAVVYEALDLELDRPVAIKILNTELVESPELQARFVKEAEAAIHIDSPFVVNVHAVGKLEDGHPYIVMELLDGENLGRLLDRMGLLKEERAVELAIHALSGLAHAHSRGVLHRDIKPDNLVIVRSDSGDEVLKIVDLGISKLVDDKSLGLTRTNTVMGSPVYMSPEQARGAKHMDHRSDVFSVGVVLFECLTGKLPHDGDNFNELMFKIALEDAPDPRTKKADLDPQLAEIIMKALKRDLAKRFQSASAFREALLEWGADRGARAPPTPSSSSSRMQLGEKKKRRLELDDDDDLKSVKPPPKPDNDTPPKLKLYNEDNKPTEREKQSLEATASSPRLVDSIESDDERARARRKVSIVVGIALVVCVLLIVIAIGTRDSASSSAAANAKNAALPAASVAPLVPTTPVIELPEPSASASAKPSKPSAKAAAAAVAAPSSGKHADAAARTSGSSARGAGSGSAPAEPSSENENAPAPPPPAPPAAPDEE